MIEWVQVLIGPFIQLIQSLAESTSDDERIEATVRFQREASDAIAQRMYGINDEQPDTKR